MWCRYHAFCAYRRIRRVTVLVIVSGQARHTLHKKALPGAYATRDYARGGRPQRQARRPLARARVVSEVVIAAEESRRGRRLRDGEYGRRRHAARVRDVTVVQHRRASTTQSYTVRPPERRYSVTGRRRDIRRVKASYARTRCWYVGSLRQRYGVTGEEEI